MKCYWFMKHSIWGVIFVFSVNFNEFLPVIHFSIDTILTPCLHFCFVFMIFFFCKLPSVYCGGCDFKSCLSVKLALVKAIIVPSSDTSQTKDHPGSRVRQKCVGGVMDWEHSQEKAAAGLSAALQLDTLRQFQLLLLFFFSQRPEPRRLREMTQGVKQAITEPSGLLFHG